MMDGKEARVNTFLVLGLLGLRKVIVYRIIRPSSSSESRPRYELSVSKQLNQSQYMTVRDPADWSSR